MNKKLILLILSFIVSINFLSGCTDSDNSTDITQGTETFIQNLNEMNENDFFQICLSNIYVHISDYDAEYKWSYLMNYAFFTTSMLNGMKNYEEKISEELSDLENGSIDYQHYKENAILDELTNSQKNIMDEIESVIQVYEENKSTVNNIFSSMLKYRKFVNLTKLKTEVLEDYSTNLDLMNEKVTSEEYEDASEYPEKLIQYCNELKDNDLQKDNLSIIDYNQTILGVWDIYIESWELYDEYLDLIIGGKYSQADTKYTEYSQKYNDALEIESSQNVNKINDQIDAWYQENIGDYSDLFEEYYEN
jgi:hypothetical protein